MATGSAFQCHCTAEVPIDAAQLEVTCQGCGRKWFRGSVSEDHFKPERLHPPDPLNHDLAECERRLKADPSYDPGHCKPDVWRCTCGRVFEHVCDEAEGCSWVHHEGATYDENAVAARSATVVVDGKSFPARGVEISYDEAEFPRHSPIPNGDCSMCGGTGLMLGGWMGPTKDAPWPRACTNCDCGRAMTPRAVQLKVMELVQRDLDTQLFSTHTGERVPGWWAARYAPILDIGDPLGQMHDAEPFDIGDQDIAKYVTDDDLTVLVTRHDVDPPFSEVATADIWKVLDPSGAVAVKKHRFKQSDYFECGDDRQPFGRCTEPRRHAGPHRDDTTGRTWG